MIVVAKGLYGLGGNISVLADALRLGEALGCGVVADWAGGMYAVDGANVADLLFDHDRKVPWPGLFDGLRVFPETWTADVARTFPRRMDPDRSVTTPRGPRRPLSMWRAVDAERYGLARLADDYDVVIVSRDSAHWHSSVDELAPYVQALRPNQDVRDGVEAVGLSRADIGVHFRHGNGERTVVPPDIGWFFDQVDDLGERMPASKVFVCTDCTVVLDAFASRYGQDRVVSSPKVIPPPGSGGMHYAPDSDGRYLSAVEAAVDIWALGACGALVGSRSFFSESAIRLGAPRPAWAVRAWVPVHRPFRAPAGVRPVTRGDAVGQALHDAGVLLDGINVGEAAGADGRWGLFYLHWPVGRLDSLDGVAEPGQVARAVRRHRLY